MATYRPVPQTEPSAYSPEAEPPQKKRGRPTKQQLSDVVSTPEQASAVEPKVEQSLPVVQPWQITPTQANADEVLRVALERGAEVDTLERLLNLQLRWKAYQAEVAFQQSFLEFKREPELKIFKDEIINFSGRGGIVEYGFSPLDKCEQILIPLLAKHDITHHWKTEPQPNGGVRVTCILKHVLCHENDDACLEGPPDKTGSKNDHQAIGSNVSYLERYTLCAACGVTPAKVDRDAITPQQNAGNGGNGGKVVWSAKEAKDAKKTTVDDRKPTTVIADKELAPVADFGPDAEMVLGMRQSIRSAKTFNDLVATRRAAYSASKEAQDPARVQRELAKLVDEKKKQFPKEVAKWNEQVANRAN